MATMSLPFGTGRDVWMLANAAVCDARDVAEEIPAPSTVRSLSKLASAAWSTYTLRRDFDHLAVRQQKLVNGLRAAQLQDWEPQACGQMAILLHDLLGDERAMLARANRMPSPVVRFWRESLDSLGRQVGEIQDLCWRIDAFSVPERAMPGDDRMREFALAMGTEEDYDLELEVDGVAGRERTRV